MAIVTDGLVLYLHGACGKNNPATRVWKDLSGNGNDGRLVNFGYTENSGWGDGGLKFDGVDDWVDCGNDESVNLIGKGTIEIMLRIEDNSPVDSTHFYGIFSKIDHGGVGGGSYNLQYTRFIGGSNELSFSIAGDNGGLGKINTYNFNFNGKYRHLVGTFDGDNVKLYVDGRLIGSDKQMGINRLADKPLRINGIFHSWEGNVKFARLYNRALTDEEILQNYQAGHEWTPQIGKREVTTTMKPITTDLSRKGTGRRELITTVKSITTSLERKGVGKREVISTMKPITSSLSRKGVGRREVITTVKPITSSISKKLPPIHANITARERIPKLEVD